MPHQQNLINESEAQNLAAGLRFIPAQGLSPDPNLSNESKMWYQGPERYFDIFIERQSLQISWVQVTFRGQYVEWKDQHLRTGNTSDFAVAPQAEHPASKMLHAHIENSPNVIRNVLMILKHRPEDKVLSQVVALFSK